MRSASAPRPPTRTGAASGQPAVRPYPVADAAAYLVRPLEHRAHRARPAGRRRGQLPRHRRVPARRGGGGAAARRGGAADLGRDGESGEPHPAAAAPAGRHRRGRASPTAGPSTTSTSGPAGGPPSTPAPRTATREPSPSSGRTHGTWSGGSAARRRTSCCARCTGGWGEGRAGCGARAPGHGPPAQAFTARSAYSIGMIGSDGGSRHQPLSDGTIESNRFQGSSSVSRSSWTAIPAPTTAETTSPMPCRHS